MPLDDDQEPVEEFAADAADETFGDRVARGACTGVRTMPMPIAAKTAKATLNALIGKTTAM